MTTDVPDLPVEASQALLVIERCLGQSLLAAYLHGSATAGGLRPKSDVDLLAVIEGLMTDGARREITATLMEISGYPARDDRRRPIELIVFRRGDLDPVAYPARSEFIYGEWLREEYEAGAVPEPQSDPEFTLLLAQARQEAQTLIGIEPAKLLPIIPTADIERAIGDALPALVDGLEGDERNVLLTLARMWRTLETGKFVPKDVAAEWAMSRLPAAQAGLVDEARQAYLGTIEVGWRTRRQDVRRAAAYLQERITGLL